MGVWVLECVREEAVGVEPCQPHRVETQCTGENNLHKVPVRTCAQDTMQGKRAGGAVANNNQMLCHNDLLGNHGQHLDLDAVELVEAASDSASPQPQPGLCF